MKTLKLWVNSEGWKSFEYENLSDLQNEFDKRFISISYNVSIGNNVSIGYEVSIGDKVRIGDNVSIGNKVSIGDKVSIGNNVSIIKSIFISGSKHSVLWYSMNCINIGCRLYSIDFWKENFREIGKKEKYTDAEINEYYQYILICEQMQNSLTKTSATV